MSDEVEFLPYEEAKRIVGNIIEEEHIREPDRRILTAYDQNSKELCWFDAEEVMREIGAGGKKKLPTDTEKEEEKVAAVEYILNRIPTWVLELD